MNNFILGKKSYLEIEIQNKKEFIHLLKDRLSFSHSRKLPQIKYADDWVVISFFLGNFCQIQFHGRFIEKEEKIFLTGDFEVTIYTLVINVGILLFLLGINLLSQIDFFSNSGNRIYLVLLSIYVPFFLYDILKWRKMVKKLSQLFIFPSSPSKE